MASIFLVRSRKGTLNLNGKVIFTTGGTAELRNETVLALARHEPSHIYSSGRNIAATEKLIAEVKTINSSVGTTFVRMDMKSFVSVKQVCTTFSHERLDLLMCNAGVICIPAGLSKDELLPVLMRTAKLPKSDVRVVLLALTGTIQEVFMGGSYRYGQSKLANIIYAAELARRYAEISSLYVHLGASKTSLTTAILLGQKILISIVSFFLGIWVAAGATKEQLVNGGYSIPTGRLSNDRLDKTAKSETLATELRA
ncbi:putative short-chain dehydrogenase [Calycina marina]|uniref:Short-chain dehydrogenase n=1 Tax=Calycina marina TaxID=1763456 RepID=A0A9P7ZBF2_9HELO|nr:putative short-chain dehydrogenase [Calycina marina]